MWLIPAKGKENMILLGRLEDKVYFLKQDPLTKKITLVVNWPGTFRRREYRSKRLILYYIKKLL